MRAWWVVGVVALASCGSFAGTSTHPTVVVEDALPSEAEEGARDALDRWASAVGDPARATVRRVDRATLERERIGGFDRDVVYVFDRDVGECPTQGDITPGHPGYLEHAGDGRAVLCVSAAHVRASGVPHAWRGLFLHELGHAFGIRGHLPQPSVMYYSLAGDADEVQPGDVEALRAAP
jgi:hypothetical protein